MRGRRNLDPAMPQEREDMNNEVVSPTCPRCGVPIAVDAPRGLCPKCVLGGVATASEAGSAPRLRREAPSLASLQAVFPQLELLEAIGQGGMGFVYRARQLALGRDVALKVLWPELGTEPEFLERFHREARVLARLSHPNIVGVYEFGRAGEYCYLVMELVDGVNLRQAMEAGRFSAGEALELVPRICEALQYAHEEGVLHRDIKPENILLTAKGRVKIVDFGIAKLMGAAREPVTLTQAGASVGTPQYMAPEQLADPESVDRRADVYSLGVVFYELLTGELPTGRYPLPSEKCAVDGRVDEVVLRALERQRERRYATADEVGTRVEAIRNTPAPPSAPAPPRAGLGAEAIPGGGARAVPGLVRGRRSWMAVVGAALAGLSGGILVPLVLLFLMGVVMEASQMSGESGRVVMLSSRRASWLFLGILLLVLIPGIAGTVLGWVACADLRSSMDGRRGAAAAVFAALAIPCVIGDGVLAGVLIPTWQRAVASLAWAWEPGRSLSVPVAGIVLGVATGLGVLNALVAVGLSRWVRGVATGGWRWPAVLLVVGGVLTGVAKAATEWHGAMPGTLFEMSPNSARGDEEGRSRAGAGEQGAGRYRWALAVAPGQEVLATLTLRSNATVVARWVMPEILTRAGEHAVGEFTLAVSDPVGPGVGRVERGPMADWSWRWDAGRFGGGKDAFPAPVGAGVKWSVIEPFRNREIRMPGAREWVLLHGDQPSAEPGVGSGTWSLRLEVVVGPRPRLPGGMQR